MLVARHYRRRLLILSLFIVGFFISSFSAVLASDFTGPVISILDGDTLEVLNGHHAERIRLSGIDCPEKGQAGCLRVGLWEGSHHPDPRPRQVQAHPWRCALTRWHERQSRAG
jgi:endonuclease YncB( thermonuclease family)